MKTKLQIFKLMAILPILVLQMSCSKKNKNNGTVAAVNTGYYMNNGQCYASNGQIVAANFCGNAGGFGNTGYYMNNGQCMNIQNQVVAITYCQQTGGTGGFGTGGFGTGGFGTTAQCVGFYYYNTGYGYQSVYCSGFSCSGYMMLNSLGQPVYCQ